jgi:hypothetical protein
MKTLLIVAFATLFFAFTACDSQNTTKKKDARLFKMLQGDWASTNFQAGYHTRRFTFSVRDSLGSVFFAVPPVSKIYIRQGMLHMQEKSFWQENEPIVHRKFVVAGVTKNYLKLVATDPKSKDLIASFYGDTLHSDTITLRRITKKNNVQPEIISFYSSGCYGTCPSLALNVESSKRLHYFGRSYVPIEGGQRSTILEKEYNELLHLIHQLPLKTLKKEYKAGWTDDQTCCIAIRTNGKWQTCYVYGSDKEPVELRMLFYMMLYVTNRTKWAPDTSIQLNSFKACQVVNEVVAREFIEFLPPAVTN